MKKIYGNQEVYLWIKWLLSKALKEEAVEHGRMIVFKLLKIFGPTCLKELYICVLEANGRWNWEAERV